MAESSARRLHDGQDPAPERRKRGATLAAAIERDILRDELPVGTYIGAEPDLLERYQVSRPAFREAVRILEHHRVAMMRTGRHGGLVVTEPSTMPAIRAVALCLEFQKVPRSQVFEVRKHLELLSVDLACDNLTSENAEAFKEVLSLETERDIMQVPLRGHDWHTTLARATGNQAHALISSVVTHLTRTHSEEFVSTVSVDDGIEMAKMSREQMVDTLRDHRAITEAILAGRKRKARQVMAAHLDRIAQFDR